MVTFRFLAFVIAVVLFNEGALGMRGEYCCFVLLKKWKCSWSEVLTCFKISVKVSRKAVQILRMHEKGVPS